jgi:hypothetical protein
MIRNDDLKMCKDQLLTNRLSNHPSPQALQGLALPPLVPAQAGTQVLTLLVGFPLSRE